MTKPNRYSKKNHLRLNRGNPDRHMGKKQREGLKTALKDFVNDVIKIDTEKR